MNIKQLNDQPTGSTFILEGALVRNSELRTTKGGKPYLTLSLSDASGSADTRAWDWAEPEPLPVNAVIKAEVSVDFYKETLQCKLLRWRILKPEEINWELLLPVTPRNIDLMWCELLSLADSTREPAIGAYLREHAEAWRRAPAATHNHHAYLGGLLEHTLSLTLLSQSAYDHYTLVSPGTTLRRDVLIAGAILHDHGKIWEMEYSTSIGRTTNGKLVGHVTRGYAEWVVRARRWEVDEEWIEAVGHIILSHHGLKEWGSPVEPATPEAILFHSLDMLDSRMGILAGAINNFQPTKEGWLPYSKSLGSEVYLGTRRVAAENEGNSSERVEVVADVRATGGTVPSADA